MVPVCMPDYIPQTVKYAYTLVSAQNKSWYRLIGVVHKNAINPKISTTKSEYISMRINSLNKQTYWIKIMIRGVCWVYQQHTETGLVKWHLSGVVLYTKNSSKLDANSSAKLIDYICT